MIPADISQVLIEYCRRNGGVRVDIHHENNPHALCGLSFDTDAKAKLLSGELTLIPYLTNHLKYSRFPISIKIDGKDLKDITPLSLPVNSPEQINLEST